jgi:hypothetical protein
MRLIKPISATATAAIAAASIALVASSAPAQSPGGATVVTVDRSGGGGGTKTFPSREDAQRLVRSICEAQSASGRCVAYTNDQGDQVVVLPSGMLVGLTPA